MIPPLLGSSNLQTLRSIHLVVGCRFKRKFTTLMYLLGTVLLTGLVYLLYTNQTRPITAADVYVQPPAPLEQESQMRGAFSDSRRNVVHAQSFQPLVIPVSRNSSFDYNAAMKKLNDAKVDQEDPRLIKLIRDYYIIPPSTEPYNLDFPDRLEYSNGQTPYVDSRLNYMEGGFYVECGALNGEKGSNTLFFEKVRKWNGLLVEADPSNFEMLKKKNRKAFIINACLNTQKYPSMMTFNKAVNRGRIVHGSEVQQWIKRQNIAKDEVQVQCFPITSLLLALNQTTLDFFSLDVEGDELRVLQTIPFDKINVKMMTVEYVHQTAGAGNLKTFVEGKGYDSMLQVSHWGGGVNDIIFRKKGLSH